eukprot:9494318-Pyramimonas_sp.AAC.1
MLQHVSAPIVTAQTRAFEMQLVRLGLGRDPLPSLFEIDFRGRLDSFDKTKVVVQKWLAHVQKTVPSLSNIMDMCGITPLSESKTGVDCTAVGIDEVIEPSNFKDNCFVKGVSEALMDLGFTLGCKVKLVKRITVSFNYYHKGSAQKPKVLRKDVLVGTTSRVKVGGHVLTPPDPPSAISVNMSGLT